MIYNKKPKSKNTEKRICSKTPAEKSIERRPIEANKREVYGHWEGDLVIGTRKKGAVLFTTIAIKPLSLDEAAEKLFFKLANPIF